jgi:predicted RNA methylase
MTQSIKIKYPLIGDVFSLAGDLNNFLKSLENQQWEYDCIKHIVNTAKSGQTILDVGAWIGPYTVLFSKLVNAGGKVYSFEPNPKVRKILHNNIRKNRLNNVEILDFAVSDVNGYSNLEDRGKVQKNRLR